MMMNVLDQITEFLHKFTNEVEKLGIDTSSYNLDHVAYQASSTNDYESLKPTFEKLGNLVHEAVVGGRRVAVFRLKNQINYDGNKIIALEIIEPKEKQVCESGWEHAEFVIEESYEDLMTRYPDLKWDTTSADRPIYSHLKLRLADNMQLKFHKMDILETIKMEESNA